MCCHPHLITTLTLQPPPPLPPSPVVLSCLLRAVRPPGNTRLLPVLVCAQRDVCCTNARAGHQCVLQDSCEWGGREGGEGRERGRGGEGEREGRQGGREEERACLLCCTVLQAGNEFRSDVYNDTISIVELEEGFDGETFFMYVFMISGLCLLMFVAHYVYTTVYRKVCVWAGQGRVGGARV